MASILIFLGIGLLLQFGNAQNPDDCYIDGKPLGTHGNIYQYTANCMSFSCSFGKWITTGKYNTGKNGRSGRCLSCRLANDPHITTFDGAKYDWHGDCTYVVAQEENPDNKNAFIYNKFTKCGRASCVDTVYFKPRKSKQFITVKKPMFWSPRYAEVVIDGHSQQIEELPSSEMQVLIGGPESRLREYPVLAYWLDNCIHIIAIDTDDFLVVVCSYFIEVYSKRSSSTNVEGMCGSPDGGDANQDLKMRNGTVVRNPNGWGWSRVVNRDFAESWEVDTIGACGATSGRKRRDTPEVEEEPCKATDALRTEYMHVCDETIPKHPSISEDMRKDFIDGCAFDRCIITQSGANKTTINEWLNEWTKVAEHEVFVKEHQEELSEEENEYIDYLADYYDDYEENNNPDSDDKVSTTPAPELTCNISRVIEAGYRQFAFFACPKTYSEARDFCQHYGWELATPNDQFEEFNQRMPNDGEYWLDVKPAPPSSENSPMIWFWQTSPLNQTTPDQWKEHYFNIATASSGTNCASLYQNDGLLAFDCNSKWFFACESFHFLNVQRRERNNEVHGQKRVSPLRNI